LAAAAAVVEAAAVMAAAAAAAMEEAPVGSFGVHQQSAQVPLFFLKIKWNGFGACS
jgi:hypothetical protein